MGEDGRGHGNAVRQEACCALIPKLPVKPSEVALARRNHKQPLRGVKQSLDPYGILNPSILLP